MRFVTPELADPMQYPKAVRRAVVQRQQAVRQARRDHNERIHPLLPPSLQRLQEMELDDARIRSLRIDAGQRTLELCLICGDLQRGYFELTLDYKGIQLTRQETSLVCLIAHESTAEIDCHEIDVEEDAGSPVFIHRISWHTRIETDRITMLEPEIELRFGGLEIEAISRPDRHVARAENVITVVRDTDEIQGVDSATSQEWSAARKQKGLGENASCST